MKDSLPIVVLFLLGKSEKQDAFLSDKLKDGNEPMITIYSNRIEILSRGGLTPLQTKTGFFRGHSVHVNARLSEILLQPHIDEKTGRGIPVISPEYGEGAFDFWTTTLQSPTRSISSVRWVIKRVIKR